MRNVYESEIFASAEGLSMHPGGLRLTDRAARLAALSPGMLAADIGAGDGATASFLALNYHLRIVGLEISGALVEAGLKKHPGLRLIRWDCGVLPFEDNSLDAVFIECALSVIGRPETVLPECARCLKKRGALILSDIVLKPEASNENIPIFTVEELLALLSRMGFDIQASEDHTPALRTYAAELRAHNTGIDAGALLGIPCLKALPRLSELGYTLIIARKTQGEGSVSVQNDEQI